MKKSCAKRIIGAVLLLAILAAGGLAARAEAGGEAVIGVIGGADGPTSIFISSGGPLQNIIESHPLLSRCANILWHILRSLCPVWRYVTQACRG